MANTYTQLYTHFVFAVQNRQSLISSEWKQELYRYISGIVANNGQKLYVINGMPDHIHMLVSMNGKQAPSDFMYHVKRSSSIWINDKMLVRGKFAWQEGYGAFSYGKAQVKNVIAYIEDQEKHHSRLTFLQEYVAFLKLFDVEYDERYVFKEI